MALQVRSVGCALLALSVAGAAVPQPAHSASGAAPDLRCPLEGSYDPDNAFARIIRGEAPVSMIAENDLVLAFVPLEWRHPGQALVAPRRAVRNLKDLTDAELLAVIQMVKRISVAQERGLGSTGFTLEQNNGRNQDVCHAHFHVIPNTAPDSGPANGAGHRSRAEMNQMAATLKAALPPD